MQNLGAPLNTLTAAEEADGWQLLFDGETTNGWRGEKHSPFPEKVWRVEESSLALTHPTGASNIYTERGFQNFDLKFDWKIAPGSNSGVKYEIADGRPNPDWNLIFMQMLRPTAVFGIGALILAILAWRRIAWFAKRGPQLGAIILALALAAPALSGVYGLIKWQSWRTVSLGYEYQIIDDSGNPDALSKGTHVTGSLYDLIAPQNNQLRPVGQFNESRILVQGNHVEHWLNGSKVVEYELGSPQLQQLLLTSKFKVVPDMANKVTGPIMLQDHHSQVWFRNIKIRPL